MLHVKTIISLLLGTVFVLIARQVDAFPGQTPEEATAWIQAHPTLRPARGERLLVRKTDTAARRFTFEASLLQVGKASSGPTGGTIRTEQMTVFDVINGVTRDRLQEYLRVIYGPIVYRDYTQAGIVYTYPDQAAISRSVNRDTPLLSDLQGEVREGERYAYWLEIVRRPNGPAYSGRIAVFLRDDLPKLEAELRGR